MAINVGQTYKKGIHTKIIGGNTMGAHYLQTHL